MHDEIIKALKQCLLFLRYLDFRFFFYSDEHLPIHVHVEYGGNDAKIEIATRKVVQNRGLKQRELKKAIQLIEMYEQEIIKAWYDYFDKE